MDKAERLQRLREVLKGKKPIRVPIPGLKDEFGGGDLIQKLTESVGIKPCSACEKLKEYLNRRLRFRKRYKLDE
jgi:hypothetical protein